MRLISILPLVVWVPLLACDNGHAESLPEDAPPVARSTAQPCRVERANIPLRADVRESSGLARSGRDPGLFWTHNDAGNEPLLFALDTAGALVQRVRVTGAELDDWEDIEAAPCGEGHCLYVGDIGDNDAERDRITVYRIPEPAPGATESAAAEPLHARFPDGPRDAEGLFVDGAGDVFVVSKGRRGAIALYRYPDSLRPGAVAELEHVRDLFPEPADEGGRVTAASTSPDGRLVGIRSYRTLFLYPADRLVAGDAVEPTLFDLSPLNEAQGEGLVLGENGTAWVSSEAADGEEHARLSRLRCVPPAG